MKSRAIAGVVIFSMMLTARPTRAEEAPEEGRESAVELGKVVVTADRREVPLEETAEIITVVTAAEIRRMNPTSTGEILEAVAGVNRESGTGSGYPKRSIISLNGMPAQYVLVLVNGQKLLTDHIHTGQNVDMIPPEAIQRIEIIETAASAQYGSDAIGGIVNIITRGDVRRPVGKLYGSFGSNATGNTGMRVAAPVGERVRVSMFADWETSDGPDVLAPAHRLGNMGYGRISVLNDVGVAVAPGVTADLYFNFFQNRMEWQDDEVYSRLLMPKADVHVDVGEQWRITGTVEYTAWEAELSGERNELLHPELFATWTAWEGRNRLTFGAEYDHNWFARTGLDGTRTQDGYGLYAHDAVKLGRAWSLSGSLRLDQVEGIEPVVSPKAAVLFRPLDEAAFRLAVGRGFHAPTLQERYEQAYGHGGTALRFGNPDLEPETSTSFALSADVRPVDSLRVKAAGYLNFVDNFIVPKYAGPWAEDPTKNRWVRTNILRAWLWGGEASVRWNSRRWLRLEGGYSYGGNRDESADEQLRFRPGHAVSGRAELRVRFGAGYRLNLFVKALHRAGRSAWDWKPAQDAAPDNEEGNITPLADYTLLDAGAEFAFRGYSASFTATNLLSQDIERLDDVLTRLDGEPLYRVGLRFEW